MGAFYLCITIQSPTKFPIMKIHFLVVDAPKNINEETVLRIAEKKVSATGRYQDEPYVYGAILKNKAHIFDESFFEDAPYLSTIDGINNYINSRLKNGYSSDVEHKLRHCEIKDLPIEELEELLYAVKENLNSAHLKNAVINVLKDQMNSFDFHEFGVTQDRNVHGEKEPMVLIIASEGLEPDKVTHLDDFYEGDDDSDED